MYLSCTGMGSANPDWAMNGWKPAGMQPVCRSGSCSAALKSVLRRSTWFCSGFVRSIEVENWGPVCLAAFFCFCLSFAACFFSWEEIQVFLLWWISKNDSTEEVSLLVVTRLAAEDQLVKAWKCFENGYEIVTNKDLNVQAFTMTSQYVLWNGAICCRSDCLDFLNWW